MRKLAVMCLAMLLMPALHVQALAAAKSEELVVKSTKVERDVSQVTDSVSLITQTDLDFGNYTDFSEALRATPSVQFKRNGGPGQFSYPKLRGFGAGHFLVVVDGMKVNDAHYPGIGNFFSQLDSFLIERAEVLRGPQSVLYGSDTTAGVFALTTRGGKPGLHFLPGLEYGSLDWKKGYASLNGQSDGFRYALNMTYTDSEGVIDYDTYRNFTPHLKLGYGQTGKWDIEGSFFKAMTKQNFNQLQEDYGTNQSRKDWWAFQLADPNNYNETEYTLATLRAKHRINASLSQKLTLGWYRKDNTALDKYDGLLGYINAPENNFTLDYVNYYSRGSRVPVYDDGTGVASYTVNENMMADYNFIWDSPLPGGAGGNTLLFGLEYLYQKGKSWGGYGDTSGDFATLSFYANDQVSLLGDRLILNAGARYVNHEEFGDQLVGKVGAAYTFPSATTLFANGGTTFRAPTVFQLYSSQYGNENLKPEEGWTVEAGLRQEFKKQGLKFELTFWHTELDQVIDFEYTGLYTGQYQNADEAKSEGLEFSAAWKATKSLTFLGNYTYTDSKSLDDGVWSRTVQIARHSGNLGARYSFNKRFDVMVNLYYSGPRLRWAGDVEMKEYFRVDLAATFRVYQGLAIYGRVQNLFDETIEEGLGFEEPGIYAIVGLRWDFDLSPKNKK